MAQSITATLNKVDLAELTDLFDSFVDDSTESETVKTNFDRIPLHWQVILDDIPTLDRTVLLPSNVAQIAQQELGKLVLVSGELSTETLIGFNRVGLNSVEHQAISAKNLINVWDSILDFYSSASRVGESIRTTGIKIIEVANVNVEDYLTYLSSLELFSCHVLADSDSEAESEDSATYSDSESEGSNSELQPNFTKIAPPALSDIESTPSAASTKKSQKELSLTQPKENSQHSATVPSLLGAVGDNDDTQWLIPQGQFVLVSFDHTNDLGKFHSTTKSETAAKTSTPINLTLRLFTTEN